MLIKDYIKGDEIQILQLFKAVFGQEMSLDYWKWRFEDNPAGKHMIKLMWENDILIGHYAVSPCTLSINNQHYLSTLSMTTMTHPDHGGKGIFSQLADALYEKLENRMDVKAIWGFPNSNSHYGFIKNLDWNDLGIVSHLRILANRLQPVINPNIKSFENFTDVHSTIINKVTSEFPIHIVRDAKYLNWRYVENPTSKYDKFEYVDEELHGFIIVKEYPSTINPAINDLFITEIGIDISKIYLLPVFLSHIASHYGQTEASINIWLSLYDPRHIHLEKLGYNLEGKPTYMGVRPNPSMVNLLSNFRNWYYSYGDSDIY